MVATASGSQSGPVATAATRWSAAQVVSNQPVHHLAMVATASGSQSGPVATAATRWSAAQAVLAANPPSGDGGYRKRVAIDRRVNENEWENSR
jgi:hypothetical protein